VSEWPPQIAPEPSHAHFVVSEHSFGLKRVAKRVGAVVATGATFVAALAGGVLVHVGSPPARRLASAAVNQILSGTFRGKIDVVSVGRLQPNGIDGAVVTLSDQDGRPLALVEGVRARISLFPLLASLMSSGDLKIRVTDLSIDHIDVLLAQAADGSLTIANAFQPAEAGPPPPPAKKSSGLDLSLERVALKHAWIHGATSAVPLIDAELDDLAGSFRMTPDTTSVAVRELHFLTRGMPNGADVVARLEADLSMPADAEQMTASGRIRATVGGIDLRANGTFDRKQLDATLDVPQADPAHLDRLLGGQPVYQVATAHIEAHGTLPRLRPSVHLTIGEGTIDLQGNVALPGEGQPDTLAQITVAARNLDARAASATVAASKLGADISAAGRLTAAGGMDGSYDVHVLAGAFGGQATPEARITGTFTPSVVRGAAHVAEPGMPSDLRFEVNPVAKGGPDIAFDASIRASDLARVPVLHGAVGGCVVLQAGGRVALGTKRLTARVQTTLDRIDAGGVTVGHANVDAEVDGTIDAPAGVVAIAGQDLHAGQFAYSRFDVTAAGSTGEIRIGADLRGGNDPAVTATATLGTRGALSARDVVVTLEKENDKVTARIASARSAGGQLDVEGVRVEGAGDPLAGELHFRRGILATRVSAPGLDIPTLLRLGAIKTELKAGRVALDVDLTASRRVTSGHANVRLDGVDYGTEVRHLDAKLATAFDGRRAEAHLDAHAAKSSLKIDIENGMLGAGALDPRAWTAATGRVRGDVEVDLHQVEAGARGKLPFDDLRGWLSAKLEVARDDAKLRPTIALDGSTRDLVFTTEPQTVPNGDGTVTIVGRAFHSQGLDAKVKGTFDAQSGKMALEAELADKVGRLVGLNGVTVLPVNAFLGAGDLRAALLVTPVRAHIDVPVRSIGAVPALSSMVPARGELGITADVEGTAREPHLQALLHARNIVDENDPTPVPLSFDTAAFYDGAVLRARFVARQKETQVMDLVADVAVPVNDVLAGALSWEASADARFTKFPVGAVTGFFDENAIDGDMNGSITLRDLHKSGQLDVDLDLANITINGAKFGDTKASAKLRDGSLAAEARLQQMGGFAAVQLKSGLGWGGAVSPTLDTKMPMDVALQAKNFRLGMLAPFLRSVASELDGRLNADTKLHVLPGMKDGTMDGAILVDRGLFETPALGEELHNLRARIFMKPWGVWNVAEVSADGTSGHFTANAVAHVNGFALKSGDAHLKIAEKDKLPLATQGMPLGTVWGQIDAKGNVGADGKTIDVDVSVPSLHIALPQSIAHGVQSTTPDDTIKVGSVQPGGVVAILPVDGSLPPPAPPKPKDPKASESATKMHIVTHLGPNLEIRRDTTVRAYVTKGPTIDIGDETKVSGGIEIPRGYIELQGKRFQIERGKVTFTGQPVDDPVVVATAAYEASDGTKVYADFVGPVKTGKLTLRSQPQLSQNEILALLLFGSADGTFGQSAPPGQQGNDATQAVSLAGGVVTQGLNKAISGISGVEVQTKVDTQDSGDPRPEVEVALARDVSATIVYNLGVPPPGQNPDDTLLVIDWRFHKNYSTQATVGDKGTSILDLTWKYRY
jgi:translocation and assembly module TamB